jgi:hypothetical protein
MKRILFLLIIPLLSLSCDYKNEQLSSDKNSEQQNNSDHHCCSNGRFPQGSDRYVSSHELYKLTQWDLKIMRNEILARHGYIFQTKDMKEYFLKQKWYEPKYDEVDDMLSEIEKDNLSHIRVFEK